MTCLVLLLVPRAGGALGGAPAGTTSLTVLPTTSTSVLPTTSTTEDATPTTRTTVRQTTTTEEADSSTTSTTEATTTTSFTTSTNLLVPGDGGVGSESTTTTEPNKVTAGERGLSDKTLVMLIIAGLLLVALLVAILTWRFWRNTRPELWDDDDDGSAATSAPRPGRPGGTAPAHGGR
jgi:flagellar biosynthesis/type III secretory pathway M-ring protein FliF/YscJ